VAFANILFRKGILTPTELAVIPIKNNIYALTIAMQFIETGRARKVVVVGADKISAIIDYADRATVQAR
jgi:3-Oxoacyl-[acyl-carrier-protein (ACP)] synthase III